MNHLLKFLKGIAIGIANVIPGFSGATMAIIVNIYDEFIGAMAEIIEHPLKVIKKSWSLFVGVIAGSLLALFTIVKLLEIATLPTILFFVGLIIGSIPTLYKEHVNLRPFKISYLITLLVTILVVIGLPFLNENVISTIDINFLTVLILFFMGIISASAMVIPGVSGSMLLMIFGYYAFIMGSIKEFIELALSFDFSNIWPIFLVLLSFGIGVIVGIVAISKLIKIIYNKYSNLFHIGVLGLLLASPFAILYASNTSYKEMFNAKWYLWVIGAILLVVGTLLSYFASKNKKKN